MPKNHQTSHFELNGHQIRIQRIFLRLVACVKIDFGDIWKKCRLSTLKTLEIMKNIKSWETVTNIGLKIKDGWLNLAKKYTHLLFFTEKIIKIASRSSENCSAKTHR